MARRASVPIDSAPVPCVSSTRDTQACECVHPVISHACRELEPALMLLAPVNERDPGLQVHTPGSTADA